MLDFLDDHRPTDLIAREQDEMLRTSTRTLTFPDGETRRVEAHRVTWAWFDRLIAYDYAPDEAHILKTALACVAEEVRAIGDALTRVLEILVLRTEDRVGEVTDHNLALVVAQRRMDERRRRKHAGGRRTEGRCDGSS